VKVARNYDRKRGAEKIKGEEIDRVLSAALKEKYLIWSGSWELGELHIFFSDNTWRRLRW